jgi:cellular nucleic acid-binding protein
MDTIYTLELENGKYYVGKTNDLSARLSEHFNGNGSEWTRMHKVLNVYSAKKVPSSESSAEETRQTSEMMLRFGANNVRGAEYTSTRSFSNREIETNITSTIGHHLNMDFGQVRNQLLNNTVTCFKCGKQGHYANQCYQSQQQPQQCCFKCGRPGHYANNCYSKTYAKTYVEYGDYKYDDDDDYESD